MQFGIQTLDKEPLTILWQRSAGSQNRSMTCFSCEEHHLEWRSLALSHLRRQPIICAHINLLLWLNFILVHDANLIVRTEQHEVRTTNAHLSSLEMLRLKIWIKQMILIIRYSWRALAKVRMNIRFADGERCWKILLVRRRSNRFISPSYPTDILRYRTDFAISYSTQVSPGKF